MLSSFLILLQPMVAWNGAITLFFNFFEFFCYVFRIFYYALGRNETERQFLFSFFLGLFQPILASNEAILAFFDFLNFLQFFWNFELCVRLGQNEIIMFIFSLSLPFLNYFGLKWCHNGIFFIIFFYFLAIFLEFSITRWVETKQNDNIYFLSFWDFSNLFWL